MKSEMTAEQPTGKDMSKSSNLGKMLTIAAALAGLGAIAVYVVKAIREKAENGDSMVDQLLDFYADKASELDKLVGDTDYRVAN
jgi:hypothetical protein